MPKSLVYGMNISAVQPRQRLVRSSLIGKSVHHEARVFKKPDSKKIPMFYVNINSIDTVNIQHFIILTGDRYFKY